MSSTTEETVELTEVQIEEKAESQTVTPKKGKKKRSKRKSETYETEEEAREAKRKQEEDFKRRVEEADAQFRSEGRIDYILTYSVPDKATTVTGEISELSESAKRRESKRRHLRDLFFAILQRRGVQMEEVLSRDDDEVFVKIFMPLEVLFKEAEDFKLRVPLKEPADWDENLYDYDFSGAFSRPSLIAGAYEGDEDLYSFFRPSVRALLTHSFLSHVEFLEPDSYGLEKWSAIDRLMGREPEILEPEPGYNNTKEISVNSLLASKALTGWFPLHDYEVLDELTVRWVWMFWKKQPLDDVREYFGEKIALYFAWLGHYTTWLWSPSIIGIITMIVAFAGDGTANSPLTVVFAIFIMVWGTIYLEYWKRNQAMLAYEWDTLSFEEDEQPRPEFYGDEGVSLITGEREIIYDPTKRLIKYTTGAIGIIFFLTIVIISVLGIIVYRIAVSRTDASETGKITAGIVNAVLIGILNWVYGKFALFLNDWENHRTQTDYEDQLIVKTFLFQFINSYVSLFYMAYFKPNADIFGFSDSCENDDCLTEVTFQLGSILLTRLVIGNTQEVLLPWIMYKWRSCKESATLTDEEKEKEFTPWEKQSKLGTFEDTFAEYNEMIIQFGYITLFVAAFPIAPFAALVNNLIEIRSDAYKLCVSYRRPPPLLAADIGTWFAILEVMTVISVMTNALIIAFTSDTLRVDLFWRFWILIIAEHAIFLLKFTIAEIIPDMPEEVQLAIDRENYQLRLMAKRLLLGDPEEKAKHKSKYDDVEWKFDVDEDEEAAELAEHFQKLYEGRSEIDEYFPSEIPYYDRSKLGGAADVDDDDV